MLTFDFTGQVALITGAGQGIGRGLALAFAAAGAAVLVNDLDSRLAQAVAAEVQATGGDALAVTADVRDRAAVEALAAAAVARWGRIDILVNNAGVEPVASILEMSETDWDLALDTNLKGTFLCTQAVGRVMQAQGRGAIVNIASTAGKAQPLFLRAGYAASKAGQVGFTKEAAREFAAYGVRVNAVCPGVIVTPMTEHLRHNEQQMARWLTEIPARRLGEVADVTPLVLFLASDAAAYIIGQAIHVDGGKLMA
ncbi:SDR family NAD(P)-dependent oxidoreductase [Candidatus Amarolinea aalborgensis]|uniref:SDR family NAD(P)-dependent oxidoreductase n=1 Tax=Candidatus Amarolinea aalborgensis TaxID=2249329 RepID=UPI003BF96C77